MSVPKHLPVDRSPRFVTVTSIDIKVDRKSMVGRVDLVQPSTGLMSMPHCDQRSPHPDLAVEPHMPDDSRSVGGTATVWWRNLGWLRLRRRRDHCDAASRHEDTDNRSSAPMRSHRTDRKRIDWRGDPDERPRKTSASNSPPCVGSSTRSLKSAQTAFWGTHLAHRNGADLRS